MTSQETSTKIQRATMRLAQLQARQALQEMRQKSQARARERRHGIQQRQALGEAVVRAGLGDWSCEEIAGLLMSAKAHFGTSDTARKLLAQRAAQPQQYVPTP
jgi:IS30 family transposase